MQIHNLCHWDSSHTSTQHYIIRYLLFFFFQVLWFWYDLVTDFYFLWTHIVNSKHHEGLLHVLEGGSGYRDILSYALLFQILSACININEVFVSHPHPAIYCKLLMVILSVYRYNSFPCSSVKVNSIARWRWWLWRQCRRRQRCDDGSSRCSRFEFHIFRDSQRGRRDFLLLCDSWC